MGTPKTFAGVIPQGTGVDQQESDEVPTGQKAQSEQCRPLLEGTVNSRLEGE